ncbi:RagB/SusD family nutrient uptake outer membrane protein [Chitinophaga sp. XS-30]|uniref:RagB/SusD family nutrient uptake outer membrane protein n=1 Tax=Chitinophaga sp. XS-30 TaxID=2604421 RepID=UPI0011DE4418|nr:RagB/SusD family nutrient uptake outer membrane protein [Chitinophaga sp. XS-30]QEH41312.1 RagB/SusD family nutrient uptake outer membrane protein [Chitinophaga sp. XS-30]
MTINYSDIFKSSVLLLALGLSSCDKFLDERPNKTSSLEVTTVSQLDALLNNFISFYNEGNRTAIHSTDDYGLTVDLYNARPGTFTLAAVEFATWDKDYLPDDTREGFWSGEYRKIFTANMALSLLETVSGTAEEKAIVKADAHFVRAYSYFQLACTYCLPYTDANKTEAGLPIKVSTSFEEPLARQPLETVYNLIEADLAEALKTTQPLMQDGRPRHWRASKAGVNAFAARYYLTRNNYAEALKHANASLGEYSTLVDYNTEMRYGRPANITINAGTPESQTVTLEYPYTHDNQSDQTDMIGWKEFLYYRMLSHESWWYIPSQALLDLYDKDHDLRYRYHMVEGYSYDRGMTKPAYDYPGYVFFYKDRLPSGPTVAEMLLVKAECLARTNKPGEAMTVLNQLRAKRMEAGPWVDLAAANMDDAIAKVLQERRRELPFTQRWTDIRRFNNNDYPADDVELSRDFYPYNFSAVQSSEPVKTYTLPKNSRRFAAPVPRTEMIASNDEITQNTY